MLLYKFLMFELCLLLYAGSTLISDSKKFEVSEPNTKLLNSSNSFAGLGTLFLVFIDSDFLEGNKIFWMLLLPFFIVFDCTEEKFKSCRKRDRFSVLCDSFFDIPESKKPT